MLRLIIQFTVYLARGCRKGMYVTNFKLSIVEEALVQQWDVYKILLLKFSFNENFIVLSLFPNFKLCSTVFLTEDRNICKSFNRNTKLNILDYL